MTTAIYGAVAGRRPMSVPRMSRVVGALALLALGLAACARVPEIPFDRTANVVKTIGLVTPRFPDSASVILASTPGQSFGLIGALIDGAMQSDRDSRFKAVLEQQSFSAQDKFQQAVTVGLAARGYSVVSVPMTRDKADFVAKYPTDTGPPVDAYLDLVTTAYGYIAAGVRDSTPYRPNFVVKARLVRATDSTVLMQDTVIYNPIGPGALQGAKGVVTVAPDPQFQFTSFDLLASDPAKAAMGLDVATVQTAQTVCDLLR